jgi:hypothetical protein
MTIPKITCMTIPQIQPGLSDGYISGLFLYIAQPLNEVTYEVTYIVTYEVTYEVT